MVETKKTRVGGCGIIIDAYRLLGDVRHTLHERVSKIRMGSVEVQDRNSRTYVIHLHTGIMITKKQFEGWLAALQIHR